MLNREISSLCAVLNIIVHPLNRRMNTIFIPYGRDEYRIHPSSRGMNTVFIFLQRDEYGIHPSKKIEDAERGNISTLKIDIIPLQMNEVEKLWCVIK